jgi:hypothetical protein
MLQGQCGTPRADTLNRARFTGPSERQKDLDGAESTESLQNTRIGYSGCIFYHLLASPVQVLLLYLPQIHSLSLYIYLSVFFGGRQYWGLNFNLFVLDIFKINTFQNAVMNHNTATLWALLQA